LRDNNINFTVIEYLKEPISHNKLHNICQILGISPIELVRTNDKYFKTLNVNTNSMNNDEILDF
jgi:Arsenate reductase and related proteins, glutaredoxin family